MKIIHLCDKCFEELFGEKSTARVWIKTFCKYCKKLTFCTGIKEALRRQRNDLIIDPTM